MIHLLLCAVAAAVVLFVSLWMACKCRGVCPDRSEASTRGTTSKPTSHRHTAALMDLGALLEGLRDE